MVPVFSDIVVLAQFPGKYISSTCTSLALSALVVLRILGYLLQQFLQNFYFFASS